MQIPRYLIRTSRKSVGVAHKRVRFLVFALVALIGILFATSALAADRSKLSDANAAYQQERSICLSGKSNQDRATCLREAGAALDAARRGRLNDGQAEYQKNSVMRCNKLPEADRPECVRRMQDDAVVGGSVEAGGVLRESVTTVVGQPADAAPGPAK